MHAHREPLANLERTLARLDEEGLRRSLRALPGAGGKLTISGRTYLNFSSNDYLNLANDPRVKAASAEALARWGCSASASRLMTGHLDLHEALEADLAHLAGTETALVFGSGFLTNLGVLSALCGRTDTLFADRLNHASLIDGMRLTGVQHHRYRHGDLAHLEELLAGPVRGQRVIATDSIFSMDGDLAPLEGLADLARRHDALLVVDEAHAIGIFGPGGAGATRCENHRLEPDVIVGTLSKALGGYGGFAACSKPARDLLINRARPFIYSTGLPPACAGAARGAIAVLESEPDLGARLLENARRFHDLLAEAGFRMPPFESQILPVLVGENQKALDFSQDLWDRGIVATAIRPPTVPTGTARLRLSVTLAHTPDDLAEAARAIAQSAHSVGVL